MGQSDAGVYAATEPRVARFMEYIDKYYDNSKRPKWEEQVERSMEDEGDHISGLYTKNGLYLGEAMMQMDKDLVW